MLSLLFATAGPQTHVATAPRPLSATPAAISEALPPRAARGQPFNRRRRARPAPAPTARPMGDSAGAAAPPPGGLLSPRAASGAAVRGAGHGHGAGEGGGFEPQRRLQSRRQAAGYGRGARLGGSGATSARAWWGQLVGEMGLPRRGPGGRSRPAPRRELRARSSAPAAPRRRLSPLRRDSNLGRCPAPVEGGVSARRPRPGFAPALPPLTALGGGASCAVPPPGLGGCDRGACQVPTGGGGYRGDSGGCFCPGSKVKMR